MTSSLLSYDDHKHLGKRDILANIPNSDKHFRNTHLKVDG
jgi:hypothetical protein